MHSATVNDYGAVACANGEFAEATHRPGLEIYGLMTFGGLATAVEYGAAHGASR